MSSSRIQLFGLTKSYGPVAALDGLSLDISGGEIFSLVGRNGAGKSTALRAVMGLSHCQSGTVRIGGRDVRSSEGQAVRAKIGYVPQHPILYDHLTGREFLRFLGEFYEIDLLETSRPIQRVLDVFEMTDVADQYIRGYSIGMKKKISIAASLLHEPQYLIMDEPTTSLDPGAARIVEIEMRRFRDLGRLVLFSTHDMDLAERLSDRVGVLNAGKLVFEGAVEELRRRHATHPNESLDTIFLRLAAKRNGIPVKQNVGGLHFAIPEKG